MSRTPILNPFDEDERSGRRPVVWAIFGLGVLCICGLLTSMVYVYKPDPQALINKYFATATPTATNTLTPTLTSTTTSTITSTPSPTSTPGPTKTPNSTATQRALRSTETAQAYIATASNVKEKWAISFSDTFDENSGIWPVNEIDADYGTIAYQISGGKYIWDVIAQQPVHTQVGTDGKTYRNFYVSVDVQKTKGSDIANLGIVFRKDNKGNFYYFGVSDFIFFLYIFQNGTQKSLITPMGVPGTQVGGIRNVAVLAEKTHFTFFINNKYVTAITNSQIPSGEIALAVELFQTGDHGVFEFDNIEILVPK